MRTHLVFAFLLLSCSADKSDSDTSGTEGSISGEDSTSNEEDSASDGDDDGDGGGGDSAEDGYPEGAVLTEEGTCHPKSVLNAADGAVYEELTVLGYPHGISVAAMLGNAEDVASFQAAFGIQIDTSSVDFERQSILYAQVGSPNTCGVEEDPVYHVVDIDDAIHLSLEMTVPDGLCETTCDQTWTEYAAIAVLREPNLTVCARRVDICEE